MWLFGGGSNLKGTLSLFHPLCYFFFIHTLPANQSSMQETLQVFKGAGKYCRKCWKFATLSEDKSTVFNPRALCGFLLSFFFPCKFQVKFLDAYRLYILMSAFAKDFFKQRHKSLNPLHNSSGYWSDMLFLYFEKLQCSNNQQEQEYWTSKYGTLCSRAITVPMKYAN